MAIEFALLSGRIETKVMYHLISCLQLSSLCLGATIISLAVATYSVKVSLAGILAGVLGSCCIPKTQAHAMTCCRFKCGICSEASVHTYRVAVATTPDNMLFCTEGPCLEHSGTLQALMPIP